MLWVDVRSPFTLVLPDHLHTYRVGKAKAVNIKTLNISRAILHATAMIAQKIIEVLGSIIRKAV